MKRIFISTNYDQLYNVIRDNNDSEGICEIKNKEIVKLENETIILIQDSNDKLPQNIKVRKNDDFLLYHTGTADTIKKLFSALNIIQGRHDALENGKYYPVFKTILGNSENKTDDIIQLLFASQKAEAHRKIKADFLNYIYNGKTPNSFPKLKQIPQIDSFKELYQSFNKKPYNNNLDYKEITPEMEEQERKLCILREALLGKK